MNEIKVNLENLSDLEQEQLMALVKRSNKPQSKAWRPDLDEKFWYIDFEGDVESDEWFDCSFCDWMYVSGNCFSTPEEAKFYREKLRVIVELKRFADEHNDPLIWGTNSKGNWEICFNYTVEDLYVSYARYYRCAAIYFSSEEIAKQAIEVIGKERIIKYYLGVLDD